LQHLIREALALDEIKADDVNLGDYMPADIARILNAAQELVYEGFEAAKSVYGVSEKTPESEK
jgi:thiazole synthase ThiGH ThiG subunit